MKCFAPGMLRTAILVLSILCVTAKAFAQVPYQRPSAPPQPSRVSMQPRGVNRLQKIVPRNKIAGPANGQRGAGVPHRVRRKPVKRKP